MWEAAKQPNSFIVFRSARSCRLCDKQILIGK